MYLNLTYVENLKYNAISKNFIAGWSSLVARQAHNLKVLGSNPSPATNKFNLVFNSKFIVV